jgi:hypothetical protein
MSVSTYCTKKKCSIYRMVFKWQGTGNLEFGVSVHKTKLGHLVGAHHQGRMSVLQYVLYTLPRGQGSTVSIATHYRLDGLGIESQLGRVFPHLSRPALGPTHPPIYWVPFLSRG